MINKAVDVDLAVADISDGATVMVGGFGEVGTPTELIEALIRRGARHLTIVSNNAGAGRTGLAGLLAAGQVDKIICSYPRSPGSEVFEKLFAVNAVKLELVPQGTLAERIRAAGAGIPAFFTPTGAGTLLAADKEVRSFDGRDCVLERALGADFALVKAAKADRWGNLVYRRTARNFGPIMCTAAATVIAQVGEVVEIGVLDPEMIITPAVYVDRIVQTVARHRNEPRAEMARGG